MSESKSDELLGHVKGIFDDFNKAVTRLRAMPTTAKTKTKKIMTLFQQDIFKDKDSKGAWKLFDELQDLTDEFGHALLTVLSIELRREGISSVVDLKALPTPNPRTSKEIQPQQIIQVGEQTKGGGWTGYFSARKWASVYEKYLKLKEEGTKMTPDISTAKEVIDILEFGRQLLPELNLTLDFLRKSIDHLSFFDDEDTKERFRSELRVHLGKVCGIVRTFSTTSTEYRIECVNDRKLEVAKSIIGLQMAEYQALGGISKSDLYKMASEMAGPEDASRK